jgi:flavorubredoxin
METRCDEIAANIYRLSTPTDSVPGGFTYNQFLVMGDEPLLFHTGQRELFDSVAEAVATVTPVDSLRWISFGHWEADESGSMNQWLEAAPHAEVAIGGMGVILSANDQAIRPARSLGDGEVLDLGGPRLRWIDTLHVPHAWDSGLLFDETTQTLLCGDLLAHTGAAPPPLTEDDVVGPAVAAEDLFGAISLTPDTAPTIRRLAELEPTTLGLMHGSSYRGDGATALRALADDCRRRLDEALARTAG